MTGKELCNKFNAIYPDIGACGIDIKVNVDKTKETWMAGNAFPLGGRWLNWLITSRSFDQGGVP
jgi:hypothetical protein